MSFSLSAHASRVILAVLIFIGTALLFLPSVRYAFVDYDDQEYVIENPHMREGLTWGNIKWAFLSAGYADNWHPLAWISMMADVSLAGPLDDESWNRRDNRVANVMHLHSVLLHAANAALLFFLMMAMGAKMGRWEGGKASVATSPTIPLQLARAFTLPHFTVYILPLTLTLLWAVHPLRCEVVCWCSERKELLCVFFMLLAMMYWVRRQEDDSDQLRCLDDDFVSYVLALFFFALAILSKPLAVSLPAALFAWDWIFRGRPPWLKIVPFGLLSLAGCLLTMVSQNVSRASGAEQFVCQRLESFFVAPLIYLRQTVWPAGLSSFYKLTFAMNWAGVVAGIALVAAIVWVCVRWLRRREPWAAIAAFGVSWVYIGLLPMLGVVKAGPQEHADRYTYWVGCGVCAVAMLILERLRGVERIVRHVRPFRPRIVAAGFVCVLALAFLARSRMGAWRNTVALMRDSLPKSWYGENAGILASHLEATGRAEDRREAEMWLRSTMAYRATPAACGELALFLSHQKHPKIGFGDESPYEEARYLAHRSLAGCKEQAVAWEALGNCDAAEEKWDEAIGNFEKALPHSKKPELVRKKIVLCRERSKQKGRG